MLDSLTSMTSDFAFLPVGDARAPLPSGPRMIVPRRPLRLSPKREGEAPDARKPRVALNIFADVFDADPLPEGRATVDARVAASRRRARRKLATVAGNLSPHEANFWHPSAEADPSYADHPGTMAHPATNDRPDLPVPLHHQLARVRHALYAEPSGQPSAADQSRQIKLASLAMNATLVVVAFPVGAAVTLHSVLRGGDIRLSAQAMSIVAAVVCAWQNGIERLL